MYNSGDDYQLNNSSRFESGDSAYLTRDFTSGNRQAMSLSFWFKRASLGSTQIVFCATIASGGSNNDNNFFALRFDSDDKIAIVGYDTAFLTTKQVFRDTSAWYHCLLEVNSTSGSEYNRVKMAINGTYLPAGDITTSYPSENHNHSFNVNGNKCNISSRTGWIADGYFDGYLAEIHYIDGSTAYDPSHFGETDDFYGHWKPIEVTAITEYGTNGFYLDFADSGALGDDESGKTNDLTPTNLAAADQVLDSPTNNFCVLNINHHDLERHSNNFNRAYSQGALKISTDTVAGVSSTFFGTMGVNTGKWYFEAVKVGGNVGSAIGIGNEPSGTGSGDNRFYYSNGDTYFDGGSASYGDAYSNGEVIGVAFDVDNQTVEFYNEGVSQGEITSAFAGGEHYFPQGWDGSGSLYAELIYNFGQDSSFAGTETAQGKSDSNGRGDFYYAPPSGFLALCTKNLPAVAVIPSEHFNTVLYTGNATDDRSITGVGFQPDFVWIKSRSDADFNYVQDSVRGAQKQLITADNSAETSYTNGVKSFTSDGFTLGTSNWSNENNQTRVAWNWKANGSGSSNTDGDITSTVSANVNAGFSIVGYTGNGSAGQTIGHGLSKAPEMMWIKNRSDADNWVVYVKTGGVIDETDKLRLDTTMALVDDADAWNDTATTATVFTVDTDNQNNGSGNTHIAYCFHSVEGYSKVGAYTGNGKASGTTGGTFVYTGFRPAWVMVKRSDTADNWIIRDYARSPDNPVNESVYANESNAEYTGTDLLIDMTSNGFKARATDAAHNASGGTYIYIAFAETPFKYSNAR